MSKIHVIMQYSLMMNFLIRVNDSFFDGLRDIGTSCPPSNVMRRLQVEDDTSSQRFGYVYDVRHTDSLEGSKVIGRGKEKELEEQFQDWGKEYKGKGITSM